MPSTEKNRIGVNQSQTSLKGLFFISSKNDKNFADCPIHKRLLGMQKISKTTRFNHRPYTCPCSTCQIVGPEKEQENPKIIIEILKGEFWK